MNLKSVSKMSNGTSEENRLTIVKILNVQLADHFVLTTKTKFYHWNVFGPHFHDIHLLLDEHYEILSLIVDDLAEQNLKLGGQAAGTLEWFKKNTNIKEDESESIPETHKMIENLVTDHELIMTRLHADIKEIDEKYDDAVTSNKLQDISDKHHKMAWMLRKIIQKSDLR